MHGYDPPRGGQGTPHPERHDATDGGHSQERQQRDVERSNTSPMSVRPEPLTVIIRHVHLT